MWWTVFATMPRTAGGGGTVSDWLTEPPALYLDTSKTECGQAGGAHALKLERIAMATALWRRCARKLDARRPESYFFPRQASGFALQPWPVVANVGLANMGADAGARLRVLRYRLNEHRAQWGLGKVSQLPRSARKAREVIKEE